MIAYKVVREVEGFAGDQPTTWYWSAVAPITHSIEYRIGEVAKPTVENSLIMVFDTKDHAFRFRECNVHRELLVVLECEVGQSIKLKQVCSSNQVALIATFWASGLTRDRLMSPPTGTLGVEWCKPIRVVEL